MTIAIPTLRTDRCALVPLRTEDAAQLNRIYQDESILRYFPASPSPLAERAGRFVASQQRHWEKYGYGHWGILPDGEKEIAGWVGLQYLPELNQTEVAYLLTRSFWGKGLATECARASISFGFETFPLEEIIGLVDPNNLASRRVLEKCGMTYQDTLDLWGMSLLRHRLPRPAGLEKQPQSATD